MARASSGSRSSISSIEPLMSAKSTVTILRSPWIASPAGCSDVTRIAGALGFGAECLGAMAGAAVSIRAAPHSPQKSSPGSFEALHCGQRRASGPPHFAQNFRPCQESSESHPSRLSAPQFEQRMKFPFNRTRRFLVSSGVGKGPAGLQGGVSEFQP